MFLSVNILLNNAEDKQIRNVAVKQWLNELIEATYDVEDMMDEIETEDLRYKLEGGGRSSISHEKQHKSWGTEILPSTISHMIDKCNIICFLVNWFSEIINIFFISLVNW